MQHLTIATSSGIVWLMLVCHFGAALIALVAGTIALSVAKGGRLHKRSGLVFTCAMIATGVLAGAISVYEGKSVDGIAALKEPFPLRPPAADQDRIHLLPGC